MNDDYISRYQKLYSVLSNRDFESAAKLLGKSENTFAEFIDQYIYENGLVRQAIMRRADVAVSYGYKILTGEKHTNNRNIILRICIAMNMQLDMVQKALSLYGMSALGDSRRDEVLSAGIVYRQTVDEIDDWLVSLKMEPLMDSYDR